MSRSSSRDEWITLHAQYLVSPEASHHGLLLDAHTFLDGAHGIVQTMSDLIDEGDDINLDRLSSALNGVALLVELGRRCVAQADRRTRVANTCE